MSSPLRKHDRIDWTDLIWLGYLLFMFIDPIERHSSRLWAETAFATATYIGLYLGFLRTGETRLRLILLCAMFLLGAATYTVNSGATCMFVYVAALVPFVIHSALRCVTLFALEAVFVFFEANALHLNHYSWLLTAVLITVVGGSNIFMAQKMRADCKLRMKQEEIEALAAVAERERIARDLHDVLGHTLSVIVLKTELAGRLLDRQLEGTESADKSTLQRARTELADVERTARTALAEVREAIGGYRARGLGAEIDAARSTLASAGVQLIAEANLKVVSLSAAEETVLALALREAVTNIVRHARATTCHLRLVAEGGVHRLSIEDNGEHATSTEGNGLRGMRARVESLGGQLSLSREAGTHLLIELPLRAMS